MGDKSPKSKAKAQKQKDTIMPGSRRKPRLKGTPSRLMRPSSKNRLENGTSLF